MMQIMQSHYPERVVRIVVVNVPFFLGSAWKVIASVLPKVSNHSHHHHYSQPWPDKDCMIYR